MKKQIFLLISLVFLLNLFWEVLHTPLYASPLNEGFSSLGEHYYMFVLLYASFIDVLMISMIFGIITLRNRSWKWINKPSFADSIIIVITGFIIAIVIEYRALNTGRWAYGYFMPTIFGIGLTPLIQLATTALLALWLVRK